MIGRDEEIRRVIQVLSRRTKNNPVLIGEPGVGKTAIAEGLAGRIVQGDVLLSGGRHLGSLGSLRLKDTRAEAGTNHKNPLPKPVGDGIISPNRSNDKKH